MRNRPMTLMMSVALLLAGAMACRLGTPTPTAEPRPAATNTPLPTITPLPEASPTSPPTPTSSDSVITDVAQVTELLFFESAAGMPPVKEREYATHFPKSTARYINYELNLEYPAPEDQVEFVIQAVWYDPDGEIFAEGLMDGYIESDWTYSAHASGQGWEEPGKWPVGEHAVELSVGGVLLASGSYEITDLPSVSGSLGGDRIAFVSGRDGNPEIYVLHADGSNVTRLTDNPARDDQPAWSPDGNWIAFSSDRDGNEEIYVMPAPARPGSAARAGGPQAQVRADGSQVTRLTDNPANDRSPAWSPDGSLIAFASSRDGDLTIYVMNADGSQQTKLVNKPVNYGRVAWSPDGSRLVFDTRQEGQSHLYVLDIDSGEITRLTDDSATDFNPAWSPDGERIAFTSTRPMANGIIEVIPAPGAQAQVNADGSGRTVLADHRAGDAAPSWSPDGERIVFTSYRNGSGEIFVMSADGSQQTNLTNDASYGEGWPAWSPQ